MRKVLKALLFVALGGIIVFSLMTAALFWGANFIIPALFICFAAMFGLLAKAIWEG